MLWLCVIFRWIAELKMGYIRFSYLFVCLAVHKTWKFVLFQLIKHMHTKYLFLICLHHCSWWDLKNRAILNERFPLHKMKKKWHFHSDTFKCKRIHVHQIMPNMCLDLDSTAHIKRWAKKKFWAPNVFFASWEEKKIQTTLIWSSCSGARKNWNSVVVSFLPLSSYSNDTTNIMVILDYIYPRAKILWITECTQAH